MQDLFYKTHPPFHIERRREKYGLFLWYNIVLYSMSQLNNNAAFIKTSSSTLIPFKV
jgi:hypothetical protein